LHSVALVDNRDGPAAHEESPAGPLRGTPCRRHRPGIEGWQFLLKRRINRESDCRSGPWRNRH
jgi:hypothetical protein